MHINSIGLSILVIPYIQLFWGQHGEFSLNGDNFGAWIRLVIFAKGPSGF
jgi:hypothetical protein